MATISNTPRPGYAWDATDNCWYPIGTGPHTHSDYITQSTAINPSLVTAKGDLIVATGNGTVTRQGIGSNGQVLTADSAEADGLKWASLPSGGSNFTLLNAGGTATTSGSEVIISGISGMDKLFIRFTGVSRASSGYGAFYLRFNSDASSSYAQNGLQFTMTSGNATTEYNNLTNQFYVGMMGDTATNTINGNMLLMGCNSSGLKTMQYAGGGGNYQGIQLPSQGYYSGSSAITSVNFVSDGTFDAGTIWVYGSAN